MGFTAKPLKSNMFSRLDGFSSPFFCESFFLLRQVGDTEDDNELSGYWSIEQVVTFTIISMYVGRERDATMYYVSNTLR